MNTDTTLTPEQTLERFEQSGAYLHGHFRLTSGFHSRNYMQCALVLQHPSIAEEFGAAIAAGIRTLAGGRKIEAVVAPAMGGLIIGHEVARALGVRFLFTERDPATRQMQMRRGFGIGEGEGVVIVEDVITTGGSTREVVDLLKAAGAEVLAAASIVDRSGGAADVGVPRLALATLSIETFSEDVCPMCREGQPVVKPGSRPA